MKNLLLTELLCMVRDRYPEGMLDRVIAEYGRTAAAPAHYDDDDTDRLVRLVMAVAHFGDRPFAEVMRGFGRHLFERFAALYPAHFDDAEQALDWLGGIERALDDDAAGSGARALLEVRAELIDAATLRMTCRTAAGMIAVADGLLEACADHFDGLLELHGVTGGETAGRTALLTLAAPPAAALPPAA